MSGFRNVDFFRNFCFYEIGNTLLFGLLCKIYKYGIGGRICCRTVPAYRLVNSFCTVLDTHLEQYSFSYSGIPA